MKKLVLIDGNSILYRAFYATPYFATSGGVQTNAVYGFINMLLKTITELKPDCMLVAFDRKEPTYRHKTYAAYKGTRKPMPEELVGQLPLVKKALAALGIAAYEKAGLEADDIIGCVAKQFNFDTVIITGDRDSFQLVDERINVYFTKRGLTDVDIISLETFTEKTGLVRPSQIIDLKACMGDSSDNIPGIPGVGEKTALSLLEKYGTLEGLYEHIDELKGKLKEKVELGKDSAFMSKMLATINVDEDLGLSENDLTFSFPFAYSARAFFAELEFNTFLKKKIFAEKASDDNSVSTSSVEIKEDNAKEDETRRFDGMLANTDRKTILERCLKTPIKRVIFKTLPSDMKFFDGDFLSLVLDKDYSFFDGEVEYVFKIRESFLDDGVDLDDLLRFLNPIFCGEVCKQLILYDKKSTMHFLRKFGFSLAVRCEDVMLEKYIVDYTQKELGVISAIERLGLNAEEPAVSLWVMHSYYSEIIKSEGVENVYREIELPLVDVLFSMEIAGFKIDVESLDLASKEYAKRIAAISREIKDIAGVDFNVNSPKQLSDVLFVKLGLKHGKKTKTGFSTNADVLEEMADEHPIIPLILKYRQLSKLASTYVDGFSPLIDKSTGLIHTVFNQTVTSTGRLSSKEPNLQNIPVRDEEGREIRKLFVPRSNARVLVGADYSQIELRLLAHYSGCEPLIKAFNSGADVHALTAAQVFGVPLDEVTAEQRRSAKAVNFGIIYGISEYGLAKNIKVPPSVAADYIKKYFENYPSVRAYMNSNVDFAKTHGYVKTAFGRRRVIPEISSTNYNLRSFGERAAMNMPLQGAAADIIKLAMINVNRRLRSECPSSLLILQVHDELIVDSTVDDCEKVKTILREEMEGVVNLSVPLTVNISVGKNWYDAK